MSGEPSIETDATIAPQATGELPGLIGTCLTGKYEVGPLMGEGGMGAVFRGRHLPLSRDVAIKVLRPEFTRHRQIAARFEREAKVVSRLEHPAIVRVFDFGSEPDSVIGRPIVYIAMELLSGRELKDALGEPMDPDLALCRAEQILEGIAHAHSRGVVHRDLKPENVFITTQGGREQLKLLDFGIAKLLEAEGPALTQMGMVFGTPTYMSPEQAVGSTADERADLYSVGVILYEMLAGHVPFVGGDVAVLLYKQVHEDPPPIEGIAPAVARLLERLLAKSADDRVQTAQDAIAEVRAARAALAAGPDSSAPIAESLPRALPADAGASASVAPMAPVPRRPFMGLGKNARTLPIAAAVGAAVLVAVVLLAQSGESPPVEPAPADVGAAPLAELQAALAGDAADAEVEEVDALLGARKWKLAGKKLDSLLTDHPNDGRLHWRRAIQVRGGGGNTAARGQAFARALAVDAALLEDPEMRKEVANEAARSRVSPVLVDALIAADATKELVARLASRPKHALSYPLRHRVLDALKGPPVVKGIDRSLHRNLDVWQAGQAEDPCAAYRQALDAMAANPAPEHLGTLTYAAPPAGCDVHAARRVQVRAEHADAYPDAKLTLPADYESKRPKKRKRRGGLFRRIFR